MCGLRKIPFFQLLCLVLNHIWGGRVLKRLRWARINWKSRYRHCFGQHLLLRYLLSIIEVLNVLLITPALRTSLIESLLEKGLLLLHDWQLLLGWELLLLVLLVLLPHVGYLLGGLKRLLLVDHDVWGGIGFDWTAGTRKGRTLIGRARLRLK